MTSLRAALDTKPSETDSVRPETRRARRSPNVPWMFAVPAVLVLLVFFIGPMAFGVGVAFTSWNGLTSPKFVGLQNFRLILGGGPGTGVVTTTLIIAVLYVVAVNVGGLLLALGLHRALRTRNLLSVLFFAPAVLSPLAVAYVWQYILAPDGPLNSFLQDIGLGGLSRPWLGQSHTALIAIVVIMVWQHLGYHMLIYTAGLQTIDEATIEAAAIDGAGAWRRFFDMVRPLLLPSFTISVTLSLISGLKAFDQVIGLTGGGPGTATQTLAYSVYDQAIVQSRYGYGAAMSLLLTVALGVIIAVQFRIMRPRKK